MHWTGYFFIAVGLALLALGTRMAWRLVQDCRTLRRHSLTRKERETRRSLLKKLSARL